MTKTKLSRLDAELATILSPRLEIMNSYYDLNGWNRDCRTEDEILAHIYHQIYKIKGEIGNESIIDEIKQHDFEDCGTMKKWKTYKS